MARQQYPWFIPIVVLALCGVAAFTLWLWDKKDSVPVVDEHELNAYCYNGQCFRDNGQYIGPDPVVFSVGPVKPTPVYPEAVTKPE